MRGLWLLVAFVVGLALGVSGTLLGPRWLSPYVPEAIRAKGEHVEGKVTRKLKEEDRLLLTIVTKEGSILATFRKRIQEIDLLVEQGDLVTLSLRRYDPFVTDPVIERVRKAKSTNQAEGEESRTPSSGGESEKESQPR